MMQGRIWPTFQLSNLAPSIFSLFSSFVFKTPVHIFGQKIRARNSQRNTFGFFCPFYFCRPRFILQFLLMPTTVSFQFVPLFCHSVRNHGKRVFAAISLITNIWKGWWKSKAKQISHFSHLSLTLSRLLSHSLSLSLSFSLTLSLSLHLLLLIIFTSS